MSLEEDEFEKATTSPLKLILFMILLIIFAGGMILVVEKGFGEGEKVASKAEKTMEFAEKMGKIDISLEKKLIYVDRQSTYTNKLIIKATKPTKLKLKLIDNSVCINFVDSHSDELVLNPGLFTEVLIQVNSVNCYLKSQKVYVEVYEIDENDESGENENEKLLKMFSFIVYVHLNTYLNVFPQDKSNIIGIFDTMDEDISFDIYMDFLETGNILQLQNDLLFYVETKIDAPITIVAKVTFNPLQNSVAQYQNTLFVNTLKRDNKVDFYMGLEPGTVYIIEKSISRGFWLLGIPKIKTGAYTVTIDYYVLATTYLYDLMEKHFGSSDSDVVFVKPQELKEEGVREEEFDEWLKKNSLANRSYTYNLISLSEVGFSSWSSIAMFIPYWIDNSGSILQVLNQKKELFILGLLDTDGGLTPSPPLEPASLTSNYELRGFNFENKEKYGVRRDVVSVVFASKQKLNDGHLIVLREMMYKKYFENEDEFYYVLYRRMLVNPYAVNVDFQHYDSLTDNIYKTLSKLGESDEDVYSDNLLPLLFFEDNIPIYLRADKISEENVKLEDVKLYVCVADKPFESHYPEKAFLKNSLDEFEDVPGEYFSCAESPERRYKLDDVIVQQSKYSILVKQYTIRTQFLIAWQVQTFNFVDFMRRWFYGHDLACKINHVGLAGLRNRPSLDKFVFILLKPECSEKSEYLTVFYTYTLKITTNNGRKINIRVFGSLYYPLTLARERADTEFKHASVEYDFPDILEDNETEQNESPDNSTITENH